MRASTRPIVQEYDRRQWDAVIDVHLRGAYLATKHVRAALLEREGGRIMTSSTSGLIGNFGQANYGAAKAGLAGFMRVAAEGMKWHYCKCACACCSVSNDRRSDARHTRTGRTHGAGKSVAYCGLVMHR